MRRVIFGLWMLLMAFQIAGCGQQAAGDSVNFKTQDGWKIVGNLYLPKEGGKPRGAVILLHQRGGQASDWLTLSKALQSANIMTLAIDQRGAGRSTEGPGQSGDDAPWTTGEDIRVAIDFLRAKGGKELKIGLAGASYGANNALIYAATHPTEVTSLALYSPGADYHGLDGLAPARSYKGPVVIYHDRNDSIAGDGPQRINGLLRSADHQLKLTNGGEHGTSLLTATNIKDAVTFFARTLK